VDRHAGLRRDVFVPLEARRDAELFQARVERRDVRIGERLGAGLGLFQLPDRGRRGREQGAHVEGRRVAAREPRAEQHRGREQGVHAAARVAAEVVVDHAREELLGLRQAAARLGDVERAARQVRGEAAHGAGRLGDLGQAAPERRAGPHRDPAVAHERLALRGRARLHGKAVVHLVDAVPRHPLERRGELERLLRRARQVELLDGALVAEHRQDVHELLDDVAHAHHGRCITRGQRERAAPGLPRGFAFR